MSNSPNPDSRTRWQPPFLRLPVHTIIEHQLELGLKGVESAIIHGPRGVGKSHAVRYFLAQHERNALRAQLAGGPPSPRALFYETGTAAGPKTALTDVYLKLSGAAIGKRSKQDWTPTQFLQQIVLRAIDDNTRLIVIDEAQLINAQNIDHLRQLNDIAEGLNHTLRLVLIGNEGLTATVAATGQLGERFAHVIKFPSLTPADVGPHLTGLHPDLEALRESLATKVWDKLVRDLFVAARGSFRRLTTIIENAHELAWHRHERISENDLRIAIDKLPPLDLL